MSDDENELEKLRLAALQTLKASADVKHRLQHKSLPYNHSPPTWRKFSGQGRGAPRNVSLIHLKLTKILIYICNQHRASSMAEKQ